MRGSTQLAIPAIVETHAIAGPLHGAIGCKLNEPEALADLVLQEPVVQRSASASGSVITLASCTIDDRAACVGVPVANGFVYALASNSLGKFGSLATLLHRRKVKAI